MPGISFVDKVDSPSKLQRVDDELAETGNNVTNYAEKLKEAVKQRGTEGNLNKKGSQVGNSGTDI